MRKKVLIVFSDDWLAYSPSVINLYDVLSSESDVNIVAFEPVWIGPQKLERRTVYYIHITERVERIKNKIKYCASRISRRFRAFHWLQGIDYDRWLKALLLVARILKIHADAVVAVDFLSFWAVQKAFGKGHLLSLEILENDIFRKHVDPERIQSVIIQSEERYKYLFPDLKPKRFLVPNAPIYKPSTQMPAIREGLIFSGTAMKGFGIYACLDFLSEHPEFSLTIKGAIPAHERGIIRSKYGHLIDEKKLFIDDSYIDQEFIINYLSHFRIGFCFYDTSIDHFGTFNYLTGPSGKLFNYYAAGVPAIASDLPGLRSVSERDTGILLGDLSPRSIRGAIERIESNYAHYSANCLMAAEYFSFDKAIEPFVEYALGKNEDVLDKLV